MKYVATKALAWWQKTLIATGTHTTLLSPCRGEPGNEAHLLQWCECSVPPALSPALPHLLVFGLCWRLAICGNRRASKTVYYCQCKPIISKNEHGVWLGNEAIMSPFPSTMPAFHSSASMSRSPTRWMAPSSWSPSSLREYWTLRSPSLPMLCSTMTGMWWQRPWPWDLSVTSCLHLSMPYRCTGSLSLSS